jgi:hypothetical protein
MVPCIPFAVEDLIRSLTIGPQQPPQAELAVSAALSQGEIFDPEKIEIHHSGVPYRG